MLYQQLKVGQKVRYVPMVGTPERGIVKSFNDRVAWVVYKCNDEWERYQAYTGKATSLDDLQEGW